MSQQSLMFPPMGNGLLAMVGRAEVGEAPEFESVREELDGLPLGSAHLSPRLRSWFDHAVQQANASSYRFEVRHLHGVDEPRVVDLASAADVEVVTGLRVREGRGTAKLSVLLAYAGEGVATVGASGVEHDVTLTAGQLVVAPAFLDLHVSFEGASLRCLSTTAHGPAFR